MAEQSCAPSFEVFAQPLRLGDLDVASNPEPTLLPVWPPPRGRAWVVCLVKGPPYALATYHPPDEAVFNRMVRSAPTTSLWYLVPEREIRAKVST
jgi:hypothetical protein